MAGYPDELLELLVLLELLELLVLVPEELEETELDDELSVAVELALLEAELEDVAVLLEPVVVVVAVPVVVVLVVAVPEELVEVVAVAEAVEAPELAPALEEVSVVSEVLELEAAVVERVVPDDVEAAPAEVLGDWATLDVVLHAARKETASARMRRGKGFTGRVLEQSGAT